MLEKLKSFLLNDSIFFAVLLILVAVSSFLLGRFSISGQLPVVSNESPGLVVLASSTEIAAVSETNYQLVASKSGAKYHLLSCPGASQIKESNKIFFASRADAEAAGFQPAANCPDLQ